MERLPITWWQIRARIIIGTATFFDAFDLLAIASAMPVLIPLWKLKPTEIGFLISAGFIGQLAGVFFFGWLAERKGRLRALILSVALFSITSFACGMAWDYWSLLIFRTIQGIGLAGEVPIAASYISELAKAHKRGRFFLLYEMIFGVGLTAAGLVGAWIVPSFGWRPMFLFGALPALLILPLWRLMPESPRWLASQGRLAEADRNVREIEDYIRGRGITLPPCKAIDLPPPPQEKTSALELFRQLYRRRTLLAWSIWFCTYFAVFGLTTWMPTIYRTVFKLDLATALLLAAANGLASLCAGFMVAFLIDIVGRRLWFALTLSIGSLPLIVLWWTGAPSAWIVFAMASLSYIFIGSNATSVYLYTAELYPTRLRAFGSSVAAAWRNIASAIAPTAIGFVLSDFNIGAVFLLVACVASVGAIIAAFLGIETKGRVLEEVSP